MRSWMLYESLVDRIEKWTWLDLQEKSKIMTESPPTVFVNRVKTYRKLFTWTSFEFNFCYSFNICIYIFIFLKNLQINWKKNDSKWFSGFLPPLSIRRICESMMIGGTTHAVSTINTYFSTTTTAQYGILQQRSNTENKLSALTLTSSVLQIYNTLNYCVHS